MKSTFLLICSVIALGLIATTESKSDEQGKDATPSKPEASDKFIGKEAGQVRDDNGLKMKLIWCPPGIFTMESVEPTEPVDDITGAYSEEDVIKASDAEQEVIKPSDDEFDATNEPARKAKQTAKLTPVRVFLSNGYWLGKYEVTQFQWKQVIAFEPWKGKDRSKEGDDFPATCVSWEYAMRFCRKLTELEREAGRMRDGWEYTLPTEAQWERACRARTETDFSFGDDESKLGEYAWFSDNAMKAREPYAHRVGQKKPNAWGLHDMHGNVWEWCRDAYRVKLPGGRDPEVATEKGANRVSRGGCYGTNAESCRLANRGKYEQSSGGGYLGFRLALSPTRNK